MRIRDPVVKPDAVEELGRVLHAVHARGELDELTFAHAGSAPYEVGACTHDPPPPTWHLPAS